MKRLFLMIVLVMLVMVAVSHRRAKRLAPPAATQWTGVRHRHDGNAGHRFAAETRRALDEARDEVRRAFDEAEGEVRQAIHEVRDEVRQAFDGDGDDSRPRPEPPLEELEEVEGLPVRIVPGTRVTVAQAKPPVPPAPRARRAAPAPLAPVAPPRPAAPAPAPAPPTIVNFGDSHVPPPVAPSQTETRIIQGQISATEERAKADARNALCMEIDDWLDPEIGGAWMLPSRLVDAMILETRINPVVKDYGTLYVAEFKADFRPERRQAFLDLYHREQVQRRLVAMAGILGFVLICLGAISGYIRTDEATKGYYTNRLRMLTAAGVGASGVIIYQMLA